MRRPLCTSIGVLVVGLTLFCSGGIYMHVWGQENLQQSSTDYSWVVYWDQDSGLKELGKVHKNLAGLSIFAVNFDSHGNFLYPEDWQTFIQKASKPKGYKKYLTVVNDVFLETGATLPKDKDVLRLLFKDEQSSLLHAQKLVALIKAGQYDGLEIDYEGFWKEPALAQAYQRFLVQLNNEAGKSKVPVRIILEPSVPFNAVTWPEGPEYVVMLYNLYGNHTTKGGPKTDKSLIAKTILAMGHLPGEKGVALATGGCTWENGAKGHLITETEAVRLQKFIQGIPVRDTSSHVIHFQYLKGKTRGECWYADGETVRYWRSLSHSLGIKKIFLWRLGHNNQIQGLFPRD